MRKFGIFLIALAVGLSFIVEASLLNQNFDKGQLLPFIIGGAIVLLIGFMFYLIGDKKDE